MVYINVELKILYEMRKKEKLEVPKLNINDWQKGIKRKRIFFLASNFYLNAYCIALYYIALYLFGA